MRDQASIVPIKFRHGCKDTIRFGSNLSDAPHAKLVLDRHETDQGGFGISDRRRCSYRRSYCSVIILGSDWVICGNAKIQNTLALSNHFRIL
jgi:hypothetical protein